MYVRSIISNNFKRHKGERTWEFGTQNVITGDNDTGKTTIGDMIMWCIRSCDMSGKRDHMTLFNKEVLNDYQGLPDGLSDTYQRWCAKHGCDPTSQNVEEAFMVEHGVYIEPPKLSVEMNLVINNRNVKIRREKTPKGNVKVMVDDRVSSDNELSQLFPAKELFMSVFVPGYFSSALDPRDRRKMIVENLQKPDASETLKRCGATPEEIDTLGSELAQRPSHEVLRTTRMALNEARKELDYTNRRLTERRNEARPEIKEVYPDPNIKKRMDEAQIDLGRWKDALAVLIRNQEKEAANQDVVQRRKEMQEHIDSPLPEDPSEEIQHLETRRAEWEAFTPKPPSKGGVGEFLPVGLVEVPPKIDLGNCPSCGVDLSSHMDTLIHNAEKHNTKTYNKQQKEWQQKVENNKDANAATTEYQQRLQEKRSMLETIGQKLTEARDQLRKRQHEIRERDHMRGILQGMAETMLEPRPELVGDMSTEDVRKYVHQLEETYEKHKRAFEDHERELAAYKAQVDHAKAIEARQQQEDQELNARQKELPKYIANLERKESLLARYPLEASASQVSQVNEMMQDTHIVLELPKQDGTMKSVFEVWRGDLPYHRLSNSARIKTDIEIAAMLNQMTGASVPIFVDNAEGVTQIPQIVWSQQHFLAYVVTGQQEVSLSTR